MTQFIIDSELPDTIAHLLLVHTALGNASEVLDGIGATLKDSTRARIATGKSSPDGTPWQRLAPATLRQKGGDILIDTGQLHASIAYEVIGDTLFIGTSKTYGAYHQFGTTKTPARPFLGLSAQDETLIQNRLNEWLSELMER